MVYSRREFLVCSGIAALASSALLRAAESSVSSRASRLYNAAFVLDANALASIGYVQFEQDAAAELKAIRGSGLTALKSTLGGDHGSFEQTVQDIAATQTLIEKYPDLFMKVTGSGDVERAKSLDRIAVIFSFEAVSMLDGKIERIELFRQLDILVMQLTYNRKSPFGCGCLDGDADGVTALGRQAIEKMNALGIALDLSHANAKTTADGIALSKKPAVITHAGCRAIYDHPRNKTDREMKALAEKDGVMGIYMMPFLTPDDRQPMLADFMHHLTHALKTCGEDHVGIGTDALFQTTADDLKAIADQIAERKKAGLSAPGENRPPYIPDANTPRKLELVADALLKKGYRESTVEKVLGLNFQRVFKEAWSI